MVLLSESRDLAGMFAAYPASLMPPGSAPGPRPRRVDHLHHHTPMTLSDHPTIWAPRQLVARLNIEHQSIWGANRTHQMEALQVDEQITPITTIKRHRAAAGRVRTLSRSLTTAGVEVRSSSRTSTSTRNPRPTPGHPHSTRKSPITRLGVVILMRTVCLFKEKLALIYSSTCTRKTYDPSGVGACLQFLCAVVSN